MQNLSLVCRLLALLMSGVSCMNLYKPPDHITGVFRYNQPYAVDGVSAYDIEERVCSLNYVMRKSVFGESGKDESTGEYLYKKDSVYYFQSPNPPECEYDIKDFKMKIYDGKVYLQTIVAPVYQSRSTYLKDKGGYKRCFEKVILAKIKGE